MPYVNDLPYVTKKHSIFQLLSPYFLIFVFSVSAFYKTKTTTKNLSLRKLSKRDVKTRINFNVYENTEYSCSVYVY